MIDGLHKKVKRTLASTPVTVVYWALPPPNTVAPERQAVIINQHCYNPQMKELVYKKSHLQYKSFQPIHVQSEEVAEWRRLRYQGEYIYTRVHKRCVRMHSISANINFSKYHCTSRREGFYSQNKPTWAHP